MILPTGKKPRRILFGAFKGLTMNLDFRDQTQVWLGLAERELCPWIRRFSCGAVTGLDVGSADGELALYFLSQAGIKHVLAFDSKPSFLDDADASLQLNGLKNDSRLTLVNKFVGNQDNEQYCTLDACAAHLPGPCVVRIDVEGAEMAVLNGAARLLARKDVAWIIETHAAQLEQECQARLTAAGLRTQVVKNAWWRMLVPDLRLLPHNRWLVAWREP
jgi:hypothetical protein